MASGEKIIGIDLGTTNSVVAVNIDKSLAPSIRTEATRLPPSSTITISTGSFNSTALAIAALIAVRAA